MLVRIDRLIYGARFAAAHESAVGTNRTWCDVRSESAFGGKAEVWLKGRQVRWDPERTSLFLATNILRWARRHKVGRARSLCGLQSNFLTAAIFGYRMVSDCANAGAFYETGTNRVL